MSEQEKKQRLNALRELSSEFLIGKVDLNGLETPIQIELYHRILNSQEKIKKLAKQINSMK